MTSDWVSLTLLRMLLRCACCCAAHAALGMLLPMLWFDCAETCQVSLIRGCFLTCNILRSMTSRLSKVVFKHSAQYNELLIRGCF